MAEASTEYSDVSPSTAAHAIDAPPLGLHQDPPNTLMPATSDVVTTEAACSSSAPSASLSETAPPTALTDVTKSAQPFVAPATSAFQATVGQMSARDLPVPAAGSKRAAPDMPDAASGLAKEARADAVGADGSCASPDAAAHRRIALLLSGVSRSGESPLGAGQSSDVPGSGGAAGASSASRPKGIGAKKAEGASGGHGSKGGKGGDGSSPKMALKAPESTKGSAGKASAGKASVGKGASSDKAGSVDHAEAAGTSSGGSATKKEGEPKVSRPRAETLKLIKARTSYQIFAEEERPAASAAARERVLATYQEAVGLRPDGKPKKVDEGEAAFKKDLAAAVVLELGKRWRALTPEQKEPFEERARKEKEAVAGDDRGGLSFDDEQARADAMLASLYLPRRKREPKRRL